jgi:ssDNA-binding replication factor A large subunit
MLGKKMVENYERLVERISQAGKIDKEEIGRRVEAKRAKLSGLVSKEGAAQIVAAELGVNFEQERMKLNELVHGMRRVNCIGKVLQIFPVREFEKSGRKGKVVNLRIGDETGNTRAVFWDTNHIDLVENGKIKEGDVIEISNAGVREGEVHLGSFSDVKLSKEEIENVVEGVQFSEKKLKDISGGERVKVRAVVIQSFEPRFFEVSAETGRKMTDEEKEKRAKVEKRALLGVVLDDGSETMRGVIFGKEIEKLGLTNEEIFDVGKFEGKKVSILGEEKWFFGRVRKNELYNTTEMVIDRIEDVNSDELVKELESKAV